MPTEAKCIRILRKLRWPNGIECVQCGSSHIVKIGPLRKNVHRYLCRRCHRTFSDLTGTIFENTKIPLNEWFYIARELQRNISINQINKDLGRKYDNVHNAARKIMDSVFMKRLIELSGEDIEVDEMYQSAGSKGKKQTERTPRKRGLKLCGRGSYDKDKPPIVAAVERNRKAVIEVFRGLNKRNMDAFLYHVYARFMHTDDFRIYDHLDKEPGMVHESVNHSKKRYSEGYKHSNTVEGMFCDLRTWLRRYKGVCKDKLYRFVSLFQFNYNHRTLIPMGMFTQLLSTLIGR
jgi:transposase-like protein/IS1 family transposase